MTDRLQFYPTPLELARRAWAMFDNKDIVRVLEPSAGRGDLIAVHPFGGYGKPAIDVIELDLRHHAILRERGYNVIGTDFLQSGSLAQYSHVIMNPPFSYGARHVLRAWDGLLEGEIVAILNAETVRNPRGMAQETLARVIEENGSAEIVKGAFLDAERKTAVDVALVHLTKRAAGAGMVEKWRVGLECADRPVDPDEVGGQIAMPRAEIENLVIAYNAAVEAATRAAQAAGQREYYKSLLGQTIYEQSGGSDVRKVQVDIAEQVTDLRARAWSAVLTRTAITDKLSSKAQERLRADFENIKLLEFTLANVHAFIGGILESQGEIQADMACDVFDLISRYHSKNRVFYRGWKSNDRHRTAGMKLKAKRFILPIKTSFMGAPDWQSLREFDDVDKVFAMLDGKRFEDTRQTVAGLLQKQRGELLQNKKLTSDYFEIRYYGGAGTVHFFPRRPELIDRLNRIVGAQRQWLPPEGERVPDAFWVQYDDADKLGQFSGRVVDAAAYPKSADHVAASQALDRMLKEAQFAAGIRDPFGAIEAQRRLVA